MIDILRLLPLGHNPRATTGTVVCTTTALTRDHARLVVDAPRMEVTVRDADIGQVFALS